MKRTAMAASALALFLTFALSPIPARSQEMAYDGQLLRLAERLGALHYLRELCGEKNGPWRERMDALIEAESPTPDRRARLIGSFNFGYNTFATAYSTCTESAISAIEIYMAESAQLSEEIVRRYGN